MTTTLEKLTEKQYSITDIVDILKSVRVNYDCYTLKIGENQNACNLLKVSMDKIKEHNLEAKAEDQGFQKAKEKFNQKIDEEIQKLLKN